MKLSDLPNHHAVLLVHSERDAVDVALHEELSSLSPVHRFFNQTVLDIDTARAIITWANIPYNDEKVAVISFHTASLPAQNAMLKILEEPRVGVRFILVTSNKDSLIDTVLSRLHEVKNKTQKVVADKNINAEEFLQTQNVSRMKLPFVIELLSQIDEEGRKDRESVRIFILSLVEVLNSLKVESRYITETLQVASYASDPSASGKALLEYLALLLPQVKV